MLEGGCHCGSVRYSVAGEVEHHGLCHCSDCRRCAGATPVPWIAFKSEGLTVTKGEPTVYHSSEGVERHFCPTCGTGLFYFNEAALPGLVDIQSVTLDRAGDFAPEGHIMMIEALPWEAGVDSLPSSTVFPAWIDAHSAAASRSSASFACRAHISA
ncbi:GFA family protein [Croceicoccus bisphenolivorans]|uniref:GFA family protein n=1 Tax=Croceicoccus bisphenolivorans TaxID=1783232 RepID=UPI00082BAFFD|nr:GFA family protein [Croceicoccus bisphenolivorans]